MDLYETPNPTPDLAQLTPTTASGIADLASQVPGFGDRFGSIVEVGQDTTTLLIHSASNIWSQYGVFVTAGEKLVVKTADLQRVMDQEAGFRNKRVSKGMLLNELAKEQDRAFLWRTQ